MIRIHITKYTETEGDTVIDVLANLDTEFDAIASATLRAVAETLAPVSKTTRERGAKPEYGDVVN